MIRKFKFTNTNLKNLMPNPPDARGTEQEYSDTEVMGLKIMVGKTGSKRFLLRYTYQSRKRSISIGKFGDIDVTTARNVARKLKAKLAEGIDPKAERDAYRDNPTLSEFFWETYLPTVKNTKKSWRKDRQRFQDYIEPRIGHIRYKDLKPIDVLHLQQTIANPTKMKRQYSASTNNRAIAIVKTMTSYALKLGIVETNVATPIGLLKEDNIRERFFSVEETKAIIKAALAFPEPYLGSAIAMLFLTGNRKNEIYTLKWKHLNREKRTVYVEDSKSGHPFTIFLSDAAYNVIDKLEPVEGNPYIFAGRRSGQPVKDGRLAYHQILRAAGITDLTGICFHTARHSVASNMISSGKFSQVHVKQQLAHRSIQSSERYIKHTPESARNISQGFADLLTNTK